MRLAIIRQRYTPFGGAERFIEGALKGLQAQGGVAVTVIAREWASGADHAGVNLLRCNPFHIGRTWRLWAFARAACCAVQRSDFDLVQSHERLPCCDIFRAGDGVHREWLIQRGRILPAWRRWLMWLSPFHQIGLWLERRMFASPRLKGVIANSEGVKRDILRHYPNTRARIEVIYNGVDLQRFHPGLREVHRQPMRTQLGIPQDAPVLLFVGSGFERKGVATAIRALATPRPLAGEGPGVRDFNAAHLVIVGKDSQQRRYETLARRLGVAHRTHFTGPQTDVRPYYGMADLFVFPSLYDPFPNAVLEAMASGLPVIVSQNCGSADFMPEAALDPLTVTAWAQAIALALEPAQRMALAEKYRAIAETLGMDVMTRKMVDVYSSLAEH